ncbi:hypothetical protein E3N88_22188 [Mikania micrantha]|uniref:C2H2-type domain-containing protein n=1 Tax=Mikania micrantha TaxID=192012 RepID=A0A5N6NBC5_9ASTR|nr:hypothetical protein E3N88_22188 [Mikania micrantha]
MEPDDPIPESSDEATTTVEENSTDQTGGAGSGSRSYECNFCKRGFTNAQALGGHMNIHRKHKPNHKESSPPPNTATGNPSPQGNNKTLQIFSEGLFEYSKHIHEEGDMIMVDPRPSSVPDVDLELRLGLARSSGNKITSTRMFF